MRLFRDLITLRISDPILSNVRKLRVDGASSGRKHLCCAILTRTEPTGCLLLISAQTWTSVPLPNLYSRRRRERRWSTLLSTEHPVYGGSGAADMDAKDLSWIIPGHAAALLYPEAEQEKKLNALISSGLSPGRGEPMKLPSWIRSGS